jgi:hypothetical protein
MPPDQSAKIGASDVIEKRVAKWCDDSRITILCDCKTWP